MISGDYSEVMCLWVLGGAVIIKVDSKGIVFPASAASALSLIAGRTGRYKAWTFLCDDCGGVAFIELGTPFEHAC